MVSRERVADFVGRQEQVRQVLSHFSVQQVSAPRVLILHAMGGQGKSQIALEYCRRMREIYRGIFWINASSESLAIQSYVAIAKRLTSGTSLPTIGDAEATIRLVVDTLERWSERWLLVFDNYDDPENFRNLRRFMPIGKCTTSHDTIMSS